MSIIDKIDHQWTRYVIETGRYPKYVYLGCDDAHDLDKVKGMVVFKYKDMEIIIVERNRHVSVGDKYTMCVEEG